MIGVSMSEVAPLAPTYKNMLRKCIIALRNISKNNLKKTTHNVILYKNTKHKLEHKMKKTSILIILGILLINTTAFGQLTQTDLNKIEKMFTASEARIKEYVDLKIDALDKKLTGEIKAVKEEIKTLDAKLTGQIDALDKKLTGEIKALEGRVTQIFAFLIALIALIAVAIGYPYLHLARRGKEKQEFTDQIETLKNEIEFLKQQIASL